MTSMSNAKKLFLPFACICLILASFACGVLMPAFYDWTGADQSRPAPIVPRLAIGFVVSALIGCVLLPWVPIQQQDRWQAPQKPRFTLQRLLITVTVCAIAFVPLKIVSLTACVLLLGSAVASACVQAKRFAHTRLLTLCLLACIWAPFGWAFAPWKDADTNIAILLTVSPALLELLYLGSLVGEHAEKLAHFSAIITALKIYLGSLLIRSGPRRGLGYCVATIIVSLMGSFALHALYRM
ncbi:hypothetical protein LOC67_12405 [Stieleria sp. JC731]|uniref:hypothetical protein n=1 Tax=Pirellulaceae TaxID=2691357 RepID=UPI001E52529E|nr:hypothetical protein [Stieleria sp. JC731]MCC9601349.1 hypothetical protein [Stieleria sp. JC731]